jgi:hypothetical protein
VEGIKEHVQLKNITSKVPIWKVAKTTKMWGDDFSDLKITKNQILHVHTKHMDIHYHYMHEHVKLGPIDSEVSCFILIIIYILAKIIVMVLLPFKS